MLCLGLTPESALMEYFLMVLGVVPVGYRGSSEGQLHATQAFSLLF